MSNIKNRQLVSKLVKRKFPDVQWLSPQAEFFKKNIEGAEEYFKNKQIEQDLYKYNKGVSWPRYWIPRNKKFLERSKGHRPPSYA